MNHNIIPNVFVGTMYYHEGDYDKCVESIMTQKDVKIKHHVIKNLTEIDAHNELWESWNKVRSQYDFFIKIDADTVLAHEFVISKYWEMFNSNNRITGIQAPLHDYFTDNMICGLNCFRQNVSFSQSKNSLYCDRNVEIGHDIVIKSQNVVSELIPAGYHCHNATTRQAFHFGVHRTLKNQIQTIELVKSAWNKHKDVLRAYVLIGSKYAHKFTHDNHSYSTEEFNKIYNECEINFEFLIKQI